MIKRLDVISTYVAYIQNAHHGKRRPVLITRTINNEKILRAILITTKYKNKAKRYQEQRYKIKDLKSCGLKQISYVDIAKHCTLIKHAFHIKKLGQLSLKDTIGLLRFERGYKIKHF